MRKLTFVTILAGLALGSSLSAQAVLPEALVISPEPGERVPANEVFVAVSFIDPAGTLDPASVTLRVSGVDVTAQAEVRGGVLTWRPSQVLPTGLQRVVVSASDRSGAPPDGDERAHRVHRLGRDRRELDPRQPVLDVVAQALEPAGDRLQRTAVVLEQVESDPAAVDGALDQVRIRAELRQNVRAATDHGTQLDQLSTRPLVVRVELQRAREGGFGLLETVLAPEHQRQVLVTVVDERRDFDLLAGEALGLPEVAAVYPKLDVRVPMGARGGARLFGKNLYTDLFMTALPEALLRERLPELNASDDCWRATGSND